MILGIGTDLCDIRRIERSLERYGDRFLNKTFTEFEQSYCAPKARPGAYYAKRFAAKEAVAKALATETSGALSWTDVEVRNDPSGRPQIHLYGTAKERLLSILPPGMKSIVRVSLTDDYPYAQAFAIVEALPE